MLKEVLIPYKANYNIFVLAPIISFTITLLILSSLPVSSFSFFNVLNTDVDILIYFALSSLSIYGVLLSGWSSNSKYAFLGGLRSAAQMISYEIFFSLVLLIIIFMSKSANILDIVNKQQIVWYIVPCFPIAIIFFIALLAETNRTPFDLPEAEAEIIAGYNIEYSSMLFALFFLSEYGNMFALSYLFTLFFLGG
jgi:NADH-quinone oxidoreductase subunit H